ncbi:MAG: 4Fe-4S binding protein [Methanobacteriaceae archaeon]
MKVDLNKCGICGACVGVCPHHVFEISENSIEIKGICRECNNCTIVCPLGALID